MRGAFIVCMCATLLVIGCTNNNGNQPTSPTLDNLPKKSERSGGNLLWGLWQVKIDPAKRDCAITPLRSAALSLNLTGIMESAGPLVNINIDWDSLYIDTDSMDDFGAHRGLEVDVILTHPLKEPDNVFMGFDVRGIVFGPRVLNADGLTRLMNPNDFPDPPSAFGYWDGLLGTPDKYANYDPEESGYKYFADGLGTDASVYFFFSNPENIALRGRFSEGNTLSRHYQLDFGAAPEDFMVFNYAVLASYDWPTGDPPFGMEDYPVETANCAEPFHVEILNLTNTLQCIDGEGTGTISFDAEVFDWQGLYDITVTAESTGVFDEVTQSTFTPGVSSKSGVFSFTDIAGTPSFSGTYELQVTATDKSKTFGQSWFMGLLNPSNKFYNAYVYTCKTKQFDVPGDTPKPISPTDITDPFLTSTLGYMVKVPNYLIIFGYSDCSDYPGARPIIIINTNDPYSPAFTTALSYSDCGFSDLNSPAEFTTNFFVYNDSIAVYHRMVADDGIHIIDLSDPTHPYYAASIPLSLGIPSDRIVLSGQYLYCLSCTYSGSYKLYIYDISDPYYPIEAFQSSELAIDDLKLFYSENDYAYILDDADTSAYDIFWIFDVSNPSATYIVSSTSVADIKGHTSFTVDIQNGYLVSIAQESTGPELVIYDIGDIYNINLASSMELGANPFWKLGPNYAFGVKGGGLVSGPAVANCIDFSDPFSPMLGEDISVNWSLKNAMGYLEGSFILDGDTIYYMNAQGLTIYKYSAAANVNQIAILEMLSDPTRFNENLKEWVPLTIIGNILIVEDGYGLRSVDISDEYQLKIVASKEIHHKEDFTDVFSYRFCVGGDRMYSNDIVADIGDPLNIDVYDFDWGVPYFDEYSGVKLINSEYIYLVDLAPVPWSYFSQRTRLYVFRPGAGGAVPQLYKVYVAEQPWSYEGNIIYINGKLYVSQCSEPKGKSRIMVYDGPLPEAGKQIGMYYNGVMPTCVFGNYGYSIEGDSNLFKKLCVYKVFPLSEMKLIETIDIPPYGAEQLMQKGWYLYIQGQGNPWDFISIYSVYPEGSVSKITDFGFGEVEAEYSFPGHRMCEKDGLLIAGDRIYRLWY